MRTIDDYLIKTGVNKESIYTKEEALKIVNEHVISIYKGRVNLTENKSDFTGLEIAEKLFTIETVFSEAFDKAVEEIEEENEKESLVDK